LNSKNTVKKSLLLHKQIHIFTNLGYLSEAIVSIEALLHIFDKRFVRTMATKSSDASDVDHKCESTKVMHTDPRYPPTAFTHTQWVKLRDWLWNTGRPYRNESLGDSRIHLFRFALGMNQIQERYGDSLLVVAATGRLSVERAARYLKPSNVTWDQRKTIDEMIKTLNQGYSPDSLVRTLTKPLPQGPSPSDVDDDRCVMHRLRKFGNRADHDGGRDIRAEEKKTIATLVYRLGFVLKAVEEQRQSDTTGEEIKRAEELRDQNIMAGDVVAAQAAIKHIEALKQRLTNPFGPGRRRAIDSVDAFKEWAATAQRCFGTGIDSWLQDLEDLRTGLASIDSAISQARDLESKYAQDEDFDQAARQNQLVTDCSRDRTSQEKSIAKHLDGLIGCVARVLTRSKPKLERLEKDLAAKVKMKDYLSAAMIKANKEAIQQCVDRMKPLQRRFNRDGVLTDATLSLLKTSVGLRASECKAAGWRPAQMKAAKFTAAELKAARFTAAELKAARFTAAELKAARFTLAELKDAKFTAIECLLAPGVSRSDLKRMGFNVDAMKAHDMALYDECSDPIHRGGRPTEVERLVKLGANGSGYKHPLSGNTALMEAAYNYEPKCVKLMLSTMSKDEAAVQDEHGWTALSYAAYDGQAECVELLLQHMDRRGVMLTTWHGKTAKEWAQNRGHTQCVALFTKYGY